MKTLFTSHCMCEASRYECSASPNYDGKLTTIASWR